MFKLILSCLLFTIVGIAARPEVKAPDGRIIGGNDASIIDHPYQVSIEYSDMHYCGGAIIARTWILTGASCLNSTYPQSYRVRVGTSYLGTGGNLLRVATLLPHSNYSITTVDFDIALLQLEDPVPLSVSAQIIGLPSDGNGVQEGAVGTISGWGYTQEGVGGASTVLQAVDVPVIDHSVCRDLYSSTDYHVSDRMFCAGLFNGGIDACNGDGGGPFVVNNVLLGTISWGLGCGRPQRPGVYTNVGLFRDWITQQSGI